MICMEQFFAMLGYSSVILGLMYVLKIYADKKEADSTFIEDQKVYEAARVFAQGDSKKEEAREILLKCIDFDEEEAEEIISSAEKGRYNSGYADFLKAVNMVLGKSIYNIKTHNNKFTL